MTIKGRCSKYPVSALTQSEMMLLLRKVVRLENETLPKPVYEQIIQDSLGYPRNALQILDQVLSVDVDSRLDTAKKYAEQQSQVIELCRSLLARSGWKKIANILTGLSKEEPEGIRRAVLGYCNSVLLSEDNPRAYELLCWFEDPTYEIGWPGITKACYAAIKPRNSDNDDIPF
jgi:DNA polymerase III gamma/tau subunit